jgi:hypothetical protein
MKRSTLTLTAVGLVWLVATVTKPDRGSKPAARYAHVAAHPGLEGLSALVYFALAALVVVAAIFVHADRGTGPGAGAIGVGAILTGITSTWFMGSYSAFGMLFTQAVQEKIPSAVAYKLIGGEASPWQHFYDLSLLALLVGPAVLAYGAHRAGKTSWLPLILWLVGFVVFGASEFVSLPGEILGLVTITAALALIGRAVDARTTQSLDQHPTLAA